MSALGGVIHTQIPVKVLRIDKGGWGRKPTVTLQVLTEERSAPATVHEGDTLIVHYDLHLKP